MTCHIFCLQDCHSLSVQLNIKARPEFLTTNSLLIHIIAVNKDLSWNRLQIVSQTFSSHIFCSMQPQKNENWELEMRERSLWKLGMVAIDLAANFCCNHARHCFQTFAHSHLELLCCLIRIWADFLFSDRSLIWICCFPQDSIQMIQIYSCALFLLQRPTNDWKIEQSDEHCFGR